MAAVHDIQDAGYVKEWHRVLEESKYAKDEYLKKLRLAREAEEQRRAEEHKKATDEQRVNDAAQKIQVLMSRTSGPS